MLHVLQAEAAATGQSASFSGILVDVAATESAITSSSVTVVAVYSRKPTTMPISDSFLEPTHSNRSFYLSNEVLVGAAALTLAAVAVIALLMLTFLRPGKKTPTALEKSSTDSTPVDNMPTKSLCRLKESSFETSVHDAESSIGTGAAKFQALDSGGQQGSKAPNPPALNRWSRAVEI